MFLENKYTNWYFSIIENAKQAFRERGRVYYEKHHITPKAFDSKSKEIVLLTAKEHFICHLLLPKMCINERHKQQMICALAHMINYQGKRKVHSRLFETIRENHIKYVIPKATQGSINSKKENTWVTNLKTNETIYVTKEKAETFITAETHRFGRKRKPKIRLTPEEINKKVKEGVRKYWDSARSLQHRNNRQQHLRQINANRKNEK